MVFVGNRMYRIMLESVAFRYFLNIFLAIIIFSNAEMSRVLGIPALPLSISVVWPGTGFALAALLLFGYRTWPGIFFGNFFYDAFHLSINGTTTITQLITAFAISLCSTL